MNSQATIDLIAERCFDLLQGPFANLYPGSSPAARPLVLALDETVREIRFEWTSGTTLDLGLIRAVSGAFPAGFIPPWRVTTQTNAPAVTPVFGRNRALPVERVTTSGGTYFLSFSFPPVAVGELSALFGPTITTGRDSLRILTLAEGEGAEYRTAFDHKALEQAFLDQVDAVPVPPGEAKLKRATIRIIRTVAQKNDLPGRMMWTFEAQFGAEARAALIARMNSRWLNARGLEASVNGVHRTFRFWTETEKAAYLADAADLIAALRTADIEAVICFDTLRGMVRGGDLAPDDDDVDILAFDRTGGTFRQFSHRIRDAAEGAGFIIDRFFRSHLHIRRGDGAIFDIVHCRADERTCTFEPSQQPHSAADTIFPLGTLTAFGLTLPVPARPETLLQDIYGANW